MKQTITGFLLVDKPAGITSFDCIAQLQRLLPGHKIGHAGTLDAFATGLLVIAIGREATAMIGSIMELDKVYEAVARLGAQTDTLDHTGTVIQTTNNIPTRNQLEQVVRSFGNGYVQTPPVFSALKYKSERLSDLVRSGVSVEHIIKHKARPIELYALDIRSYDQALMELHAHVSHGTYIRSLVNDIAVRCDSCATTEQLRRTKIGPFVVEHANRLDYFSSINEITHVLISPPEMHLTLRAYGQEQTRNKQEYKLSLYKKNRDSSAD